MNAQAINRARARGIIEADGARQPGELWLARGWGYDCPFPWDKQLINNGREQSPPVWCDGKWALVLATVDRRSPATGTVQRFCLVMCDGHMCYMKANRLDALP